MWLMLNIKNIITLADYNNPDYNKSIWSRGGNTLNRMFYLCKRKSIFRSY